VGQLLAQVWLVPVPTVFAELLSVICMDDKDGVIPGKIIL